MKRIFILMILFICIFSIGPSRGERIKESKYIYKDYIVEEDRFGEEKELWSKKYDSSGNALEETRMYYGNIGEKTRYTFDNKDKLIEVNIENDLGEKKKVVYNYNGNRLEGRSIYKNGVLINKETNVYDEKGNLKYIENKSGASIDYVYDENGKVIMKNDGVVTNYYCYDSKGNIERDICEIDGEIVYDKSFVYDKGGKVLRMIEGVNKGDDDHETCTTETKYKYNSHGDKIEERWKDEDSNNWNVKRLENIYNNNGDLVEVKEFEVKIGEKEVPVREHRYEYQYF